MRLTLVELLSFLSVPLLVVAIMFGFGQTIISSIPNERVLSAQTSVASAPTENSPLVATINSIRLSHNLSEVTWSDVLETAATARTNDMVSRMYYAHTSPSGRDFTQYVEPGVYACENLYLGDGQDFYPVNAWMNSESHKKCLLSPDVRFVGYADSSLDALDSHVAVLLLSE